MGNHTIFQMFENPRRGRQAKNFTTNVPKILDLKSSSEQIFFRKLSLGAPGTSRQTLLRGGDISVNPGSLAKQKFAKCEECEKTVRLNQKCHMQCLRIMHLNTQSMVQTCDEFLITINENPLNVITLSETRLKDNPALLDFVSVPGYSTVFRNRESIKGVVSVHIFETTSTSSSGKILKTFDLILSISASRSQVAISTAQHLLK